MSWRRWRNSRPVLIREAPVRFVVEVTGRGTKNPKARYPKTLTTGGEAPPQYRWDEDDEEE
jgi:hypothetical protein